jgi:hypothetical protein
MPQGNILLNVKAFKKNFIAGTGMNAIKQKIEYMFATLSRHMIKTLTYELPALFCFSI